MLQTLNEDDKKWCISQLSSVYGEWGVLLHESASI
jgi:hypothetical protein